MTGDQPDGALLRCPGPPAAAEVPLDFKLAHKFFYCQGIVGANVDGGGRSWYPTTFSRAGRTAQVCATTGATLEAGLRANERPPVEFAAAMALASSMVTQNDKGGDNHPLPQPLLRQAVLEGVARGGG